MNEFIQSQQELAKEQAVDAGDIFSRPVLTVDQVDTITAQIIQNTGEELLRSMPEEGIKWMQEGFDKNRKGYTDGFNEAIDNVISSIKSVCTDKNNHD